MCIRDRCVCAQNGWPYGERMAFTRFPRKALRNEKRDIVADHGFVMTRDPILCDVGMGSRSIHKLDEKKTISPYINLFKRSFWRNHDKRLYHVKHFEQKSRACKSILDIIFSTKHLTKCGFVSAIIIHYNVQIRYSLIRVWPIRISDYCIWNVRRCV